MSSWFSIKPKILAAMIVYLIILYTCTFAFASPTSDPKGLEVQYGGIDLDTIDISNETDVNASVLNGAMYGAFGGLLVGFGIVVLAVLAPFTAGVSLVAGLAIMSAGAGIGACVGGIYGYASTDDEIELPGESVVMILDQFVDSVVDFTIFLGSLISFGPLALSHGIDFYIPFYVYFIFALLCLPVQLAVIIWFVGMLLEAIKGLRNGFKFLA